MSSSKVPQSGLKNYSRVISMTSGASEPKSSQEIYWPPTPPATLNSVKSRSQGHPSFDKRMESLQTLIGGPLTDTKSLNKRPSDASDKLPAAKKPRQLPPGYKDAEINADRTLSAFRYIPSSGNNTAKVNARNAQPSAVAVTTGAKGKLARPFLSQEQQHILSLVVNDEISIFYTGSAGQWLNKKVMGY